MTQRLEIYDTTLRDGCQGQGMSLTVDDKLAITLRLDAIGIPVIEGGWPGSNPRDVAYFERVRALPLQQAQIAAFGATRRADLHVDEDPNLAALIAAETPIVTLVGKASRFQVKQVLGVSLDDNLAMVADSVRFLVEHGRRVIFDAEHALDGAAVDLDYTLSVLRAAAHAGADTIVLCDTNGGALPSDVSALTAQVRNLLPANVTLGVHTHNDMELAVANTLAGVTAGARHVQGTINGYGERTGNANLCSILPLLEHRLGYQCLPEGGLAQLTDLSHAVAEIANMAHPAALPFVGSNAFAHKGGLHVSGVMKTSAAYEHMEPTIVGNQRAVLVSDLSGRSNLLSRAVEYGLDADSVADAAPTLLQQVKELEALGFRYEDADASLELLMRRQLPSWRPPFAMIDYVALSEYRAYRGLLSEATVKLQIDDEVAHTAAEGNGPVNALDGAMRKALAGRFPALDTVSLQDYKVRVLDDHNGTGAMVRVWIRSGDGLRTWNTVGASSNVIEASWLALVDSLMWPLVTQRHVSTNASTAMSDARLVTSAD